MWIAFALLLIAYLLGSISGSLLLGKLRGVDIRTIGSGNAGGSNALRTQGLKFGLGTVLVDIGKGALATWLALRFLPAGLAPAWLYGCVLAAVAGHVWPVFHGFRGGKGAATVVGGLSVVWPQVLLPVFIVWLVSLAWGGYVGLATMLAGISLVLVALVEGSDATRLGFSIVVAALLVFTHRSNIARLRAGTESRFERVRVLGRWLSKKSA